MYSNAKFLSKSIGRASGNLLVDYINGLSPIFVANRLYRAEIRLIRVFEVFLPYALGLKVWSF